MTQLNIPYRSQWDPDAGTHNADCGPTCAAMILNYHDVEMSPDQFYNHLTPREPDDFTNFFELIGVVQGLKVGMDYKLYEDRNRALAGLRANIDAGKPMIALVKYKPWQAITGNTFEWGHFVVVTGYDNSHVYVNDPLFGLWRVRSRGKNLALTYDQFCAGWGGFPVTENPNWACAIAAAKGVPAPVAQPAPTPAPTTPAAPTPVATRPAPAISGETMDDVNLRIRALAAYRHAVPPNFADAAQVKLWQDHLGDFGLTYEKYQVQSGNTLSGLAARYFGEQHRWYAIKEYNNLNRDGLWVGETILIPHLGQSGAHTTDALPQNSANFAKSLAFEDLVDPDSPAQNYNSLGSKSVGMGFMPTDDNLNA